jgi:hypothetical protein
MQGSFNSRTYNFNTLLGRSSFPDLSVKKVVVPPFQRGYSWEKAHVATFWDDILRFHSQSGGSGTTNTYFLGPIVIMPTKENVTLLDGQQRLATTTILLGVIRDIARTDGGQAGSDLARDIQRDLLYVEEDSESYALTLSELDNNFFKESVQKDPPDPGISVQIRSHVLIKQAKGLLVAAVREHIKGQKPADLIKALKRLKSTIAEKIKIVAIEVASEDEAFLIFETLNDRGLRLSVPDLLLNHLMRAAKNAGAREQVRDHWNAVVENIATRYVSTFLRHMWVSTYGDVKAQGLYREIKEKLESEDVDCVSFGKLCSEESEKYVALLDLEKPVLKGAEPHVRGVVKSLGADMALPVLLSGLKCLDDADFEKLARYVTAIIVRYALIANLNPAALEESLYAAAREIRSRKNSGQTSAKALLAARAILRNIDPTKKQITEGIAELHLKKSEAQYLVMEIAKKQQSSAKVFAFDKISIEHIFPEHADKTTWPNMKTLAPYVWHIGNLTPLEPKLNRSIGNSNFKDKIAAYKQSEVRMAQLVAQNHKNWDEQQIVSRASKLIPVIDQVWSLA